MIPQHSTNLAQTRLTSEIGRDRVLSGWYDRAMRTQDLLMPYVPKRLPSRHPDRGGSPVIDWHRPRGQNGRPAGAGQPTLKWVSIVPGSKLEWRSP